MIRVALRFGMYRRQWGCCEMFPRWPPFKCRRL